MKLKARIRTKVHDLAVGATFSDEVNETLDSGVIIIDNVPSFDIEPFDDVFVYDGEFSGISLPSRTFLNIQKSYETVSEWGTAQPFGVGFTYNTTATHYLVSGEQMSNFANYYRNRTDENEDSSSWCLAQYLQGKNHVKLVVPIEITSFNTVSGTTTYGYRHFEATAKHNATGVIELTDDFAIWAYISADGVLSVDHTEIFTSGNWEHRITGIDLSISSNYMDYRNAIGINYLYTFKFSDAVLPTREGEQIVITEGLTPKSLFVSNVSGNGYFYLVEDFLTYLTFAQVGNEYIATKTFPTKVNSIEWSFLTPATPFVLPAFYRHMLVDTFTKERVSLTDNVYKYKITLFSETKGLENIQLPNKSFTQPLNIDKKLSVAEIAHKMVELYSPKIKVADNSVTKTYTTQRKYSLHESIDDIFENVYVEAALDEPNLRMLLDYLFSTKDRIAVVKDYVIYAVDQTERKGEFLVDDDINLINESMSSENFTGHLKRKYNQAISQNKTTKRVEYLGFRNSDEGLLTLDNMRLETRFNIYSIDKVYMCYYKKVAIQDNETAVVTDKMILCKQDITPLILLNQERKMLDKDWHDFTSEPLSQPQTIEELAQYRIATLGYDRGSNIIEGWGTKYEYPLAFWQTGEKTYIENIITFMDKTYPYGINTFGYIKENVTGDHTVTASIPFPANFLYPAEYNNVANALKGLFFEVEYTSFYDGTIIHSKDNATSDIVAKDNPASSLSVLETDGSFEKEKINRLGNAILQISALHKDYAALRDTQTVYGNDIIIYRREYAIYNDHIIAVYEGTRDFVLKNYSTSVLEKLRPFPLKPYNESILRAENKKVFLKLDKDILYNETQFDLTFDFHINKLLSGFNPSTIMNSIDNFDKSQQINGGFFVINDEKYASDVSTFVSGNSLCFNIRMDTNVTSGVYIKQVAATGKDNFKGTVQESYMTVDDIETGFIETLGVFVAHIDRKNVFSDKVQNLNTNVIDVTYSVLNALPKLDFTNENLTNIIGNTFNVLKDNQEVLDYTFQIEPLGTDDVFVSQWLMKLTDFYGVHNKVLDSYTVFDVNGAGSLGIMYSSAFYEFAVDGVTILRNPLLQLDIATSVWGNINEGDRVDIGFIEWQQIIAGQETSYYQVRLNFLMEKSLNKLVFKGSITYFNPNYGIHQVTEEMITFYRLGYKPAGFNHDASFDSRYPFGWNVDTSGDIYSFGWRKETLTISGPIDIQKYYKIDRGMELIGSHRRMVHQFNTSVPSYANIGSGDYALQKAYAKNMYYLTSDEPLKRNVFYNEYKLNNLPANYTLADTTFTIQGDDLGSYIYADITNVSGETLEYWFLDTDGALKFVFGVNISPTDRANGFIRVRMSLMNNLDKKVFSSNGFLVGKKSNYIDGDKDLTKNYYDDII